MKVFITGAAGKLGTEIVAALAGEHELTLAVRNRNSQLPGQQIELDVTNIANIEPAIAAARPDVIIHLAAVIGEAQTNPALARQVNVDATAALAQAAAKHGVKQFLFASTAAVYAQNDLAPTDEDHNIAPASVYGQTKLAAEEALAKISKTSTIQVSIFRIFNMYGPTFTNSLVYKLAHSAADQPVSLNGWETFYRDYVHVADVVWAFSQFEALANHAQYAVMNIASGQATNNQALIAALTSQGVTPHYRVQQAPASYSWADITRAKTSLGFAPKQTVIW